MTRAAVRSNGVGERMVSYFVRYRGASPNPAAFQAYYETQHAEILKQFPDVRSLVLHRPTAWTDPFTVRRGETMLLAQMQFDSVGALDNALRFGGEATGTRRFSAVSTVRRRSDA